MICKANSASSSTKRKRCEDYIAVSLSSDSEDDGQNAGNEDQTGDYTCVEKNSGVPSYLLKEIVAKEEEWFVCQDLDQKEKMVNTNH